ncbi:hypothetical protein LZK75_33420 (plasmid) [Rhizobium leguminosarum]|nr:hypothetical protein LZK75_33420 [Rhizobium leguminosarum]
MLPRHRPERPIGTDLCRSDRHGA